jgi:hypothetical protein
MRWALKISAAWVIGGDPNRSAAARLPRTRGIFDLEHLTPDLILERAFLVWIRIVHVFFVSLLQQSLTFFPSDLLHLCLAQRG